MRRRGDHQHHEPGALGRLAVVACALLLPTAPAWPADTELLSLAALPVAEGEYVSAFALDTWTVQVLAVCRMPVGWTVTAGNGGDPGGVLSGSANIGAGFVGWNQPGEFRSMFLVRVGAYRTQAVVDRDGGRIPATFAGTATVGRYGQDGERKVPLSGRNVRHQPADRCPAPGR